MTKAYIKKNINLSIQFDNFAARNPEIYKKIPRNSWLVLTESGATNFNKFSRSLVNRSARTGRFVEAMKVGKHWRVSPQKKITIKKK